MFENSTAGVSPDDASLPPPGLSAADVEALGVGKPHFTAAAVRAQKLAIMQLFSQAGDFIPGTLCVLHLQAACVDSNDDVRYRSHQCTELQKQMKILIPRVCYFASYDFCLFGLLVVHLQTACSTPMTVFLLALVNRMSKANENIDKIQ